MKSKICLLLLVGVLCGSLYAGEISVAAPVAASSQNVFLDPRFYLDPRYAGDTLFALGYYYNVPAMHFLNTGQFDIGTASRILVGLGGAGFFVEGRKYIGSSPLWLQGLVGLQPTASKQIKPTGTGSIGYTLVRDNDWHEFWLGISADHRPYPIRSLCYNGTMPKMAYNCELGWTAYTFPVRTESSSTRWSLSSVLSSGIGKFQYAESSIKNDPLSQKPYFKFDRLSLYNGIGVQRLVSWLNFGFSCGVECAYVPEYKTVHVGGLDLVEELPFRFVVAPVFGGYIGIRTKVIAIALSLNVNLGAFSSSKTSITYETCR